MSAPSPHRRSPEGSSTATTGLGVFLRTGDDVEWWLKRNCSLTPRQLLGAYGLLCFGSLSVASLLWLQGVRMVMPFAGLELLVVGVALLAYARHAGDGERIEIAHGQVTVEHRCGERLQRVALETCWVQVQPARQAGSLVELSSRGRRVKVGRYVRPELRPALASELRRLVGERRMALAG